MKQRQNFDFAIATVFVIGMLAATIGVGSLCDLMLSRIASGG